MLQFCEWLEHNPWILAMDSSVVFSVILEISHYVGFFLLVGTTVVVDLRVLGIAGRRENATELAQQLFPWMWIGLVLAVLSGFLMFAGDAGDFYLADVFRIKILIVLLAAIFGAVVQQRIPKWSQLPAVPLTAKCVAVVSLVLWIGAILASVEVPAISGVG
ncbi:MAG TPA: DUF6644 family protein [Candidatus Acidoferrales bacterium]|nr:DUF6644 family protein [Candidatus Acidoferrales bacterium]